jgi:hypothetical protein
MKILFSNSKKGEHTPQTGSYWAKFIEVGARHNSPSRRERKGGLGDIFLVKM